MLHELLRRGARGLHHTITLNLPTRCDRTLSRKFSTIRHELLSTDTHSPDTINAKHVLKVTPFRSHSCVIGGGGGIASHHRYDQALRKQQCRQHDLPLPLREKKGRHHMSSLLLCGDNCRELLLQWWPLIAVLMTLSSGLVADDLTQQSVIDEVPERHISFTRLWS